MKNSTRGKSLRILLVALCVPMLTAMVYAFVDDEGEREMAMEDAPEAIQSAFEGIDVAEVEVEGAEGQEVYEVEFRVGDDEVELELTEDGVLLSVEIERAEDDEEDDTDENEDENE